jgi:hypothetical protein
MASGAELYHTYRLKLAGWEIDGEFYRPATASDVKLHRTFCSTGAGWESCGEFCTLAMEHSMRCLCQNFSSDRKGLESVCVVVRLNQTMLIRICSNSRSLLCHAFADLGSTKSLWDDVLQSCIFHVRLLRIRRVLRSPFQSRS